jgi:sulfite oxidase
VKWLSVITARRTPSSSFFQRDDYTLRGKSLSDLPLNSVVCSPREGVAVRGLASVQGYVIAGGDHAVERVEVSTDGGVSWTVAALTSPPSSTWAWRLWRAFVKLVSGPNELVVRAWDSSTTGQPNDPPRSGIPGLHEQRLAAVTVNSISTKYAAA